MAHTSAADLAHGLKGAHFPMDKKQLSEHARKNRAPDEILETIGEMPDQEYASLADVEHAFSQSSKHESSGRASAKPADAARKGEQSSHSGGRSR